MKTFYSILSVLLFAAMETGVILTSQYLAIDGYDWITIALNNDGANPVLIVTAMVLSGCNIMILCFLMNSIWDRSSY